MSKIGLEVLKRMKKPFMERFGDFMAGKGFYIVLFLCVAAIGISGYYLFSSLSPDKDPGTAVAGPAQVTVTPTPASASPAVRVTPTPSPQAQTAVRTTPAPSPTPAATPAATPQPAAPTVFAWPVKGTLISEYSVEALAYDATMGDWRTHSGIDISAELGAQVVSAAAGTVIDVVQDDFMGTTVYLDHGSGLTSCYANLAAVPTVEIGATVRAGDVLGSVGKTAIAESALPAHLHFEMAQDGSPIDPADYLP